MSYTNATYALILFCLLGAQAVSIELGFFQLSPYRLALVLAPILLLGISSASSLRKVFVIRFDYVSVFGVWLLCSALSVVWVLDYISWARNLFFLIGGFISTVFIFSFLDNHKKIVEALKLVVLTSVIIGVLAVYEMYTGLYFFMNEVPEFKVAVQKSVFSIFYVPVTIFGNSNNYALFLYISGVFCFMLYRLSIRRYESYFYLCILVFFVLLLLLANSRASTAAMLCFFLCYFLVSSRSFRLSDWAKFIFFGFITTLIIGFYFLDPLIQIIDSFTVNFKSTELESDAIRLNLMLNGLDFLHQTYFFGVGTGQIESYMESRAVNPTLGVTNIHNWWLEILVTMGLPFFLLYLLVYSRIAVKSFTQAASSSDHYTTVINTAVFSFLVSFIIGSVGPSSLLQTEWIWPLLALLMKAPYAPVSSECIT